MTDTTLKFGPEWLRALTEPQHATVNYTPPLPNMKLADFRYGREEMLALFDKDALPAEDLFSLGTLFVEKCQFPLNLIQMGEEETRLWQRGANSDASLRPFGVQGKRPPSPTRGRGRGRGGAAYPHYERNRLNDEESDLKGRIDREDRGYISGRGRSVGFERQGGGWFDSGEKVKEEDKDAASPRKNYSRAPAEDWRGRTGEGPKPKNDDGWRSVPSSRGWSNGPVSSSWRNNDRINNGKMQRADPRDGRIVGDPRSSGDRWRKDDDDQFQNARPGAVRRRQESDHLPEWAIDDPTEGGTFDDSGKFKAEQMNHLAAQQNKWDEGDKWDEEEVDPEELPNSEPSKAPSETPITEENPAISKPPIPKPEPLNDSCKPAPRDVGENDKTTPGDTGENVRQDEMDAMVGHLASMIGEDDNRNVLKNTPPPGVGMDIEESSWTYLDPQGQVQGPFKSDEMLEWCTAGYFPHDLMVQRNMDSNFTPLSELTKLYGRNPFTPGPIPPPINNNMIEEQLKQQQLMQLHQLYLQQQHQQQQRLLAQQQLLLLHQQQQQQQQQQIPDLSNLLFNSTNPLGNKIMPDPRADFLGGFDNDPLRNLLANLNKPPELASINNLLPRSHGNVMLPGLDLNPRLNSSGNSHSVSPSTDPYEILLQQDFKSRMQAEEEINPNRDFDPIQSLLQQLQSKSQSNSSDQNSPLSYRKDMSEQSPVANSDFSGDGPLADHFRENQTDSGHAISNPQTEPNESEFPEPPVEIIDKSEISQFEVPKSREKKDRKIKKAEEKRKAKESKTNGVSDVPYIPGMPGSLQPVEQIVTQPEPEEEFNEPEYLKPVQVPEPKVEKKRIEIPVKPAPWAKKEVVVKSNNENNLLSLQEIQKLEAEKERQEKLARDQAEAEAREEMRRREDEERLRRSKQANWSAAPSYSGQVKSLAEIQAEEARVEREKNEKEAKDKKKRVKELGGKVTNWNSKSSTSWAGKIAASANIPQTKLIGNTTLAQGTTESATVVAPEGFWDPVVTVKSPEKVPTLPVNKKKKKVAEPVEKDRGKEFDSWCVSALDGLGAQVDIPTFLAFLKDIESPYEVHDYVKSYVGEGKTQKQFAVDYLERRSRWKNAKKRGTKYEDDLTTPALAITPGEGEFQEATRKGKKKSKNSKSNLNHLLGFSVQGQGVNRGELDVPH